jgi:hypothetical protein
VGSSLSVFVPWFTGSARKSKDLFPAKEKAWCSQIPRGSRWFRIRIQIWNADPWIQCPDPADPVTYLFISLYSRFYIRLCCMGAHPPHPRTRHSDISMTWGTLGNVPNYWGLQSGTQGLASPPRDVPDIFQGRSHKFQGCSRQISRMFWSDFGDIPGMYLQF